MPIDTQALLSLLGGAARGYQTGLAAKAQQQAALGQLQQKADLDAADNQTKLGVAQYTADQRLAGQKYGADQQYNGTTYGADARSDTAANGDLLKVYDALDKGDLSTGDAIALIGSLRQRSRAAGGTAPGVATPGGSQFSPKPVALTLGQNPTALGQNPATMVSAPPPIGSGSPSPAQQAGSPGLPTQAAGLPANVPLPAAPQTNAPANTPANAPAIAQTDSGTPGGGSVVTTGVSPITGTPAHLGPGPAAAIALKRQQAATSQAQSGYYQAQSKAVDAKTPYIPGLADAQIKHYNAATQMDVATANALTQTTPAKIAQIRQTTLSEGVRLKQEAQRIALEAKQVQIQQRNADTAAGNLGVSRWKAHNPTGGAAASKPPTAEIDQNNSLIASYDKQKEGILLGAIDAKTGKGRALSAAEQDLVDRADTNITQLKQRNAQLQGGTAAVDPTMSPGYAVVPGQGRVAVPSVPVLPGFAPAPAAAAHHSNSQPRTSAGHFNGAPARTVRTKSGVYTYTVK